MNYDIWSKSFMPDDFDRIYNKYFKSLRETKSVRHDPSGWLDTHSEAALQYFDTDYQIRNNRIVPYYSDYHDQLYDYKEKIGSLINRWDLHQFSLDQFTLCSSVTVGSFIVLATLAKKGIKNVIFETPAFYASINQAQHLGLNYHLAPTFLNDNFKLSLTSDVLKSLSPCAIMITQPRMSLGLNQTPEHISDLYKNLPEDSFLIVDEASEQHFPSKLSPINVEEFPRLFKLRNFYKGAGINGIRLSYISHNSNFRLDIQRELESIQGAIDVFSLNSTIELSQNQKRFESMLQVSNNQTTRLKEVLEKYYKNDDISFSDFQNGYIGSIGVDLSSKNTPHRKSRENLLKHCFTHKIPIILGSTMKFAIHDNKEFIRLNFFKPKEELIGGLDVIKSFITN